MKCDFADHGLPLIQLKEARRELVLSLQHSPAPVNQQVLAQIVNIQIAIAAIEAVVEDLDSELDGAATSAVVTAFTGRA